MITQKQRRNAERELTSIVCAGCDGPKPRGATYCQKCQAILLNNDFPLLGPIFFAEKYMECLTFLLSPRGQRLRAQA
jgi:ribosomal protein L40E